MTENSEQSYKYKMDSKIRDVLIDFECQPILFIGSGLSRRYFNAPTWLNLLENVLDEIPKFNGKFEYYNQKYSGDAIDIGTELADLIFEWAWQDGREKFPSDLFLPGTKKECFLKYLICDHINKITPKSIEDFLFNKEITSLSNIRPHAIITTNYDLSLEIIFDGYVTITGQTIIKYNTNSFGEIFHIHGDINDSPSIVLTKTDYDDWDKKKKYISAKLLTYFAEHPIFIFGYSLNDPNIKEILKDIGEIVADDSGLIENVYQIIWKSELPKSPPEQSVFTVNGTQIRINAIYVTDFQWIFDALKSRSALTSINPKLIRALAARTMKLIRHDIPSGSVQVDYDVLERVSKEDIELPKLLGISIMSNPNQTHPLTISQVATRLGFNHWSGVNKLLKKINLEKGIDLKSSDNKFHCKIKTGESKNSKTSKWSLTTIDLLKDIMNGNKYDIDV
ncbi:SIR2 family protein [Gluconobacter kondonii]|uniref:SIR2 family protein n=1 Tax=Gluconobacter kondonii TaxID=941463 RepID=UPI00209DF8F4|nr:SIR2 family protein [Gluconobacter kondonii]MCP1237815.1 SIR2 family protein [Gluconobacter kondonii]